MDFLNSYLPTTIQDRPFVTLTYAQSLDSRISSGVGERTAISHAETKEMTQYLRSQHDGILVGVNTALSDDPGLNCKLSLAQSPRPIIIDPHFKWDYCGSKMERLALEGVGQAPWIVISTECCEHSKVEYLRSKGGNVIEMELNNGSIDLRLLFTRLKQLGIDSLMVEGGAKIINSLLQTTPTLIDSLIITIGPVFLGQNGVQVSPASKVQLKNVTWWTGITDSVMCCNL